MAFDDATRSRLQRFVSEARGVLTEDFTRQLQQTYGMDPATGEVSDIASLKHLDDQRLETAEILNEIMDHYLATEEKRGEATRKAVLERIVREQAFTILNRMSALRMMEARGILRESVGKGSQSQAFMLYQRVANGALGDTSDTYGCFLLSLFDLFATDLPALFDRYAPQSRLFPRDAALIEFLKLINDAEIEPLWAEDETIGWIYQYFNSQEERRAMRQASKTPRNSRELAVRNQFFTPRYVVEFLVDNSLGRLWFNWTGGKTSLRDRCQYLIVKPDEKPEAVRQLRDPRTIKLLDPACGSMHFGLYAFDLFQEIYSEAWDWEQSHGRGSLDTVTGARFDLKLLTETYPDKDAFLSDVPRLIIEHNIYGVEIDPRAAQIASFAVWMRAQRAWYESGIKAQERPEVGRGNVVAAVAPPAEIELRKRFLEGLDHLDAVLFEKTLFLLKGLPELGVLLQVEEELPQLVRSVFGEHGELFSKEDIAQWQNAEMRLKNALAKFARAASATYQGRLFAEDTLEGLRTIDLAREVFDVIVMNPPFGEPSANSKQYCDKHYTNYNKNLLCAFLMRSFAILRAEGILSAIYDKTALVKNTYEAFRRDFLLKGDQISSQLDLGWGVLDANVEVTCGTLQKMRNPSLIGRFIDVRNEDSSEKGDASLNAITEFRQGLESAAVKEIKTTTFLKFPNAVLGYDFPDFVVQSFVSRENISESGVQVIAGHTIMADRYFRNWWEVPSEKAFYPSAEWQRLYNGGEYSRYISHLCDAVYYGEKGNLIAEHKSTIFRNMSKQGLGCLGFGKRGDYIDAHVLPGGFVSSVEGQATLVNKDLCPFEVLTLLNSRFFQFIINLYCGQHKYPGYVHLFPSPNWGCEEMVQASEKTAAVFSIKESFETADETSPLFFHANTKDFWGATFSEEMRRSRKEVSTLEEGINALVHKAYELSEEQVKIVLKKTDAEPGTGGVLDRSADEFWSTNLFHFLVGCVFGRWDIRYVKSKERASREDPFEYLPPQPPAMRSTGTIGDDADYPIITADNGIIVDEPGHQSDFTSLVTGALVYIYGTGHEEIEQRLLEKLRRRSLREYFSHSNGFFSDHLKKYSKGRRQAPIYWPISTTSDSYTIWLYYSSLNGQTLYSVVNDFIEPKLKQVGEDVDGFRAKGTSRTRDDEKTFEVLQEMRHELIELRDTLLEVAKNYKPNRDDGVQITAAPLWRLFRHKPWQKVLKETWAKLEKGDYDWAYLAMAYWPERVCEKCKTDKSLAIAHDLEHLYEELEEASTSSRGRKRSEER